MRAGLRLLVDKEDQRQAVIKCLEAAALEGLNSKVVDDFDIDGFLERKRKQYSES